MTRSVDVVVCRPPPCSGRVWLQVRLSATASPALVTQDLDQAAPTLLHTTTTAGPPDNNVTQGAGF